MNVNNITEALQTLSTLKDLLGGSNQLYFQISNKLSDKSIEIQYTKTKTEDDALWYGTFDTIPPNEIMECATEAGLLGFNSGGFVYLIPGIAYLGFYWTDTLHKGKRIAFHFDGKGTNAIKWVNACLETNGEGQTMYDISSHQIFKPIINGILFIIKLGDTLSIEIEKKPTTLLGSDIEHSQEFMVDNQSRSIEVKKLEFKG